MNAWEQLAAHRERLDELRKESALVVAQRNLTIIELVDAGAHQGQVAAAAGLAQGRISDVLADEPVWRQRVNAGSAGENVDPVDSNTR